MLKFPYGIADFQRIRSDGFVYVDRTSHVRDLENLGAILVFLRPRRFGKSLWLQTLANYYDLLRAGDFERLFGGLAVGKSPTPLRNRYFVLQWNFSVVDSRGGVAEIAEKGPRARGHSGESLLGPLPGGSARSCRGRRRSEAILANLLIAVRQTPHKLYLPIDEYDNFVNEVMARDPALYQALFETDGPFKQLFKSVKTATEGRGLERVFVTGVSPVAVNDLTSGFNNAKDVGHGVPG